MLPGVVRQIERLLGGRGGSRDVGWTNRWTVVDSVRQARLLTEPNQIPFDGLAMVFFSSVSVNDVGT